MNEADTRAEYIDKQLEAAGWSTGGDVRVQREYEIIAEIEQLDVQAAQALQAIKELL